MAIEKINRKKINILEYSFSFSKIEINRKKNLNYIEILIYDVYQTKYKKHLFYYPLNNLKKLKSFKKVIFSQLLEEKKIKYDENNIMVLSLEENYIEHYIYNEDLIYYITDCREIKKEKNVKISKEEYNNAFNYKIFKNINKLDITKINTTNIRNIYLERYEEGYKKKDSIDEVYEYKRFALNFFERRIIIEFISVNDIYFSIEKNEKKYEKNLFFENKEKKFFEEVYFKEIIKDSIENFRSQYTNYTINTEDFIFDIVIQKNSEINFYESKL